MVIKDLAVTFDGFMNGKDKGLSQLCMVIIDHHNNGMGYPKISDVLKISISTIRAIIQKWKEHSLTTAHLRKVSKQAARSIVWKVMHKLFTT